jgi:DNA modification methylase
MMTDLSLFGEDLFGQSLDNKWKSGSLFKEFVYPPFSVLNSRDGFWQERKNAWKKLGIKSEIGREEVTLFDRCLPTKYQNKTYFPTVSIFDPVMTELAYRWFCPPGGQILDPFAGGSVRGLVAGILGFKYYGIDLSEKQVVANKDQHRNISPHTEVVWVCGDTIDLLDDAPEADFIFSCPPYGNLEKYSDDPRDLSNMDYLTFLDKYTKIIAGCIKKLKDNSFACFVVGDYRDKKTGNYVGFVADTIKAFQALEVGFYNDAILSTAIGTAPIRAPRPFKASRKMTKIHQNVIVFLKGDLPSWKGIGVI